MMNNKIIQLIKINLLYSTPQEAQRQRRKGKNLNQITRSTLFGYLIAGIIFIGLFGFSMLSVDMAKKPGLFTHYVALFSLLLISQLLTTINNVFLESKDLQNYLSLPIKIKDVILSKLFTVILSVTPFTIPMIAVLLVTGIKSNYSILISIGLSLLVFILYFISIFVLSTILILVITQSKLYKKFSKIGSMLLLGLSSIGIISGCIYMGLSSSDSVTKDSSIISVLYPLFKLITDSFNQYGLMVLLSLIAISLLGTWFLIRFVNQHVLTLSVNTARKQKKRRTKQHSLIRSLIRYNLGLLNQPAFITQVIMNTILIPFIFLISFTAGSRILLHTLSGNYFAVFFIVGIAFSFMTLTPSTLSGNIISLDGPNYEFFHSLPISLKSYLKIKFILTATLQLVAMTLAVLIFICFSGLHLTLSIGLLLGVLLSQLVGCMFYFKRDIRLLNLNWTEATQLLNRGTGNWGVMIVSFGSLFFGGLLIALTAFLTYLAPIITNTVIIIVSIISLFIIYKFYQITFWNKYQNQ
ncbi:hypothetical protein ACQW5G_04680 [Fructilactobacillus sp. Tb1]|uniref:hypothetical protein n=1 Tax=Fructilactobacillus sp. Tb1 TaxID=3422304 RepID=UPI003D2E8797